MSCRSPLTVPTAILPPDLSTRFCKMRFQEHQTRLHGFGGNQHFGNKEFLAFEQTADFAHGGNERFTQDFFGRHSLCKRLFYTIRHALTSPSTTASYKDLMSIFYHPRVCFEKTYLL